jgi:hypothetical protein
MNASKKHKIEIEHLMFNSAWTDKYFFMKMNKKFLCGGLFDVPEKYNLSG